MSIFINICLILLAGSLNSFAQKPLPPDLEPYQLMPENTRLSNNGRFVISGDTCLLLKDLATGKELKLPYATQPSFNADSRFAVVQLQNGLQIISLPELTGIILPNVLTYSGPQQLNNWLMYRLKDRDYPVLLNLSTSKSIDFKTTKHYLFMPESRMILFDKVENKESDVFIRDLRTGKERLVLTNFKVTNMLSDPTGKTLVVSGYDAKGGGECLRILNTTSHDPIGHVDSTSIVQAGEGLSGKILSAIDFSHNGDHVFLYAAAAPQIFSNSDGPLKIWSYLDESLRPYLDNEKEERFATLVYAVKSQRLALIANAKEEVRTPQNQICGYAVVGEKRNIYEAFWKNGPDYFLVDCETGRREPLIKADRQSRGNQFEFHFSPDGKYVVYYDDITRDYLLYEIATKRRKIITSGLQKQFDRLGTDDWKAARKKPYGIAAWDMDGIYVYDHFDIWKLFFNHDKPVCITREQGKARNIQFRMLHAGQEIKANAKLILVAYEEPTKKNGFFLVNANGKGMPEKLILDNHYYGAPDVNTLGLFAYVPRPLKAKDTERHVLYRSSATEFPSLLYTDDFKTFKSVTSLEPYAEYKWLTSELHQWKTNQGDSIQGLLYKPEDFDQHKKYPVLFYFYERSTQMLNHYPQPGMSVGPINIPFFVSHGYLVMMVDIHYREGHPAESAFDCVTSAADYLAKKSWTDTNAFGLQGHSFGGYEVNAIISRTNRFAAACSAAGPSDLVYFYTSLQYGEHSGQSHMEEGQFRIGSTLWDRPDLFIENSPVFFSGKINTPLLLQNNKNDGNVAWTQGLQLFTSLRRQRKPVWLLEYNQSSHSLDGNEAKDFTRRLTSFFDHYLKGYPAPEWMAGPSKTSSESNKIDQ